MSSVKRYIDVKNGSSLNIKLLHYSPVIFLVLEFFYSLDIGRKIYYITPNIITRDISRVMWEAYDLPTGISVLITIFTLYMIYKFNSDDRKYILNLITKNTTLNKIYIVSDKYILSRFNIRNITSKITLINFLAFLCCFILHVLSLPFPGKLIWFLFSITLNLQFKFIFLIFIFFFCFYTIDLVRLLYFVDGLEENKVNTELSDVNADLDSLKKKIINSKEVVDTFDELKQGADKIRQSVDKVKNIVTKDDK